MTVTIALKRAYESANPEIDGYRMLVDRLWPRGISKDKAHLDEWNKTIAPSPDLRKWWNHDASRYGEFADRYREELDENPAVQDLIERMKELDGSRLTLVYGAKDPVINHAHILRNYLLEATAENRQTVKSRAGFDIAIIPARESKSNGQAASKNWNLEGLNVRKATTDDAKVLQWIGAVTFEDTFLGTSPQRDMDDYIAQTFSYEQMYAELSNPRMHYYLVTDEKSDEIAAYLKVNEMGAQTEDGEEIPSSSLEIQRLYVMPDYKGRKLGSYLMQFALDKARELGLENCWLGVWEYNFAAQKFYEKWGFERFSEHSFIVGEDNQTDFLLRRSLS